MRNCLLVLTVISLLVCNGSAVSESPKQIKSAATNRPPNFVFIVTDDQDVESMTYMPRVNSLLADQGTSFTNAFVVTPQCCPSHVTMLTGQYPHNHGVLNNFSNSGGGFQTFVDNGGDHSTIATWLQDKGYLTARFGKYLVEYSEPNHPYIPPGWSDWQALYGSGIFFDYNINDNGTLVHYGSAPGDYSTDVLTERIVDFINRRSQADKETGRDKQPFFLMFAPSAPHATFPTPNGPPMPAPRHKGMFAGYQAPRTPSFNEADVSDKPPLNIGTGTQLPLLTAAQIEAIDSEYRDRLESLQAVDEAVETIVNTLAANGELDNTYIVYTSDNGYHLGQHRQRNGKFQYYEEDIRVPLIVRGPKVPVGMTREHIVTTLDFAPTFAKLAHVQPPAEHLIDGQSMHRLFHNHPPSPAAWRNDFLVEMRRGNPPLQTGWTVRGLRTRDGILYGEYITQTGQPPTYREFYDLNNDPFELVSQHNAVAPELLQTYADRMAALATCKGETCRSADYDDRDD